MPLVVIKAGSRWLTVDTDTHRVKGQHATRNKAIQQRRVLAALQRRRKR